MRQISKEAYEAFKNKKRWRKSNTFVCVDGENTRMFLFGNEIAKTEWGETFICNGGYRASVTTRDRLSAFPIRIKKSNGSLIINEKIELGKEWLRI